MTYSIPVYAQDGKKLSSRTLDKAVFNDEVVNPSLINEYVRLQRNNARIAIANTKTRGEVNGSGKKLFKQKGMGAGRVGDKKSPLRKKGGIVFGPTSERNFSIKMNKKAKRKAIAGLITLKVKGDAVLGLDALQYKEIKTKKALETIQKLQLENKKTLVVLPAVDEVVMKSLRNIPKVRYVLVENMNPYDLASYNKLVFVGSSLETLTKNLAV